MFQDLHVIDFHAHFSIKTDMAHGHGPQKREVGPIESPAALARRDQRDQMLERARCWSGIVPQRTLGGSAWTRRSPGGGRGRMR